MKQCINRNCRETLVNDEAKFCRYCGTKQGSSPSLQDMYPIEAQWRPVLERLDVPTLGIKEIPSQSIRTWVDGTEWITSLLDENSIVHTPPELDDRIKAIEAEGLLFAYWILIEEQPKPIPTPAPLDPILIGVIPTEGNQGVWCKIGAWPH